MEKKPKKKSGIKDKGLLFIEKERAMMRTRSEKDTENARLAMSSEPVRGHLLAMVDELVRQGIYLSPLRQEAAKLFVELIGNELQKGDILRNVKPKKK